MKISYEIYLSNGGRLLAKCSKENLDSTLARLRKDTTLNLKGRKLVLKLLVTE